MERKRIDRTTGPSVPPRPAPGIDRLGMGSHATAAALVAPPAALIVARAARVILHRRHDADLGHLLSAAVEGWNRCMMVQCRSRIGFSLFHAPV